MSQPRKPNYRDKISARKEFLSLLKFNYGEGTLKWTNESLEHYLVKCQLLDWFKRNKYEVWVEPILHGNYRPDLAVFHPGGSFYAVEVLKSETERRFKEKLTNYPMPILKVYVKDFDYNTFCV